MLCEHRVKRCHAQACVGMLVLVLSAATPSPLLAEGRVQLELIGDAQTSALAFQQWLPVLGKAGVKNVRFRAGRPADRVRIETRGTPQRPLYVVTGIVRSRDELVLPSGKFRRRDVPRLAQWLEDLARLGPEARREKKTVFGLSSGQFEQVRKDLARGVGFSTAGMRRGDAVAKIARELALPLQIDPPMARMLNEDKVVEELTGLSCGTALACIVRPMGVCLVPRPAEGRVKYALVKAAPKLEVWPIGWEPERRRRDLLPAMLESHNINIQGVSAAAALDAIAKRLKVTVLLDHNSLARYGIELDNVMVSHPRRKTSYSAALRHILFQAKLKSELRVDEAGRPLLWVTTIKPA